MIRSLIAVFMLILLGATALGQALAEPSAQPLPAGWDNITDKLWGQIPNYRQDPAWYNRRVGTLHVDNSNGDVYRCRLGGE